MRRARTEREVTDAPSYVGFYNGAMVGASLRSATANWRGSAGVTAAAALYPMDRGGSIHVNEYGGVLAAWSCPCKHKHLQQAKSQCALCIVVAWISNGPLALVSNPQLKRLASKAQAARVIELKRPTLHHRSIGDQGSTCAFRVFDSSGRASSSNGGTILVHKEPLK